jgi:hypothetical protein
MRRGVLILAVLFAAACGGGENGNGNGASVSIASPEDGATVQSPVTVTMEAEGLEIEPAGEVREGAGHLHLMVDADCVSAAETIPADDAHRHLADGSDEVELELEPGEHTLCAQAGDGVHQALDATHEITITVEGVLGATEEEIWEGTIDSTATAVPATGGRCGSVVRVRGPVRLVVQPDGTVQGTYDVSGPCVSEPHAEWTGRATDEAFHFPQLIVQTNGEPIPKVSETTARATLENFQGAGGVGARWVTTWNLRCTNC